VESAGDRQAREDLAAALRLAARFGLNEGVCNHFSYALPGRDDRFLLNPHGRHWSLMRPSDMLLLDGEGRELEGRGVPEVTAFVIHAAVHAARPDARCVLHTHMPYATALTCLADPRLLPLSQNALRFHGEIAYDPDYGGLAETPAEGRRIAAGLGAARVLFMANHGVLVVGPTIAEAFDRLYYLERACQLQVLALSTGRPLAPLGDNRAASTKAEFDAGGSYAESHFAALKELLDHEDGEWRRG